MLPIPKANTVIYVGTVVVKFKDTSVTGSTVFSAERFHDPTGVTEPTQWIPSLLPLVKVCNLGKNKRQYEARGYDNMVQMTKTNLKQVSGNADGITNGVW